MALVYTVRGSLTAGAGAPKDYLTIAPATNARITIKGFTIGSQGASSASPTAWQLIAASSAATGSSYTPLAFDTGNSRAAKSTALSTITANASGTVIILEEFALDALSSYTKWYPPGYELVIDQSATSNIFAVRKVVSSDANVWSITVYFAE